MFNGINMQQKSYSEEIKSKNNNGYIFENLIPGQKFAINVTAISITGRVKLSKILYTSTEHYGSTYKKMYYLQYILPISFIF